MTLDEEAISKGWPNYATFLYHRRRQEEREMRAEEARAQAEHQAELQRRRTAGALPSPHIFTVIGGDPEAARAAKAERAANWGQAPAAEAPGAGTARR